MKYYLKFYGEFLNYICIFDVIKYYFPWHDIDEVNIWRRGQDSLYFENGNRYISAANRDISTKFGLLIDFDLLNE